VGNSLVAVEYRLYYPGNAVSELMKADDTLGWVSFEVGDVVTSRHSRKAKPRFALARLQD
jgi:hypothetical protein